MRLTTAGNAHNIEDQIVGVITHSLLPRSEREDRILVYSSDAGEDDLSGFGAVLTTDRIAPVQFPIVESVRDVDHLRDGDIVSVDPKSGFVRTLYRPDSEHNILFATGRCNSNCLMCSQPPQDRDDVHAQTQRNLEVIRLIKTPPTRLTITGGEPTLLGESFFLLVSKLQEKFPGTAVQVLTNGRKFAFPHYAAKLAEICHPDLLLAIPLYSDDASAHDHIVQAKDAFSQTVNGLHQLARFGIRVEIRVVLHALSIKRLPSLAEYIYRNLTFVEHVALMGLENIGYAPQNMSELWVDPYDYGAQLENAVEALTVRGMHVSLYNCQLCTTPRSLWKFTRKSISDWKNIYLQECDSCEVKGDCGGFFKWATKLHSSHISPL